MIEKLLVPVVLILVFTAGAVADQQVDDTQQWPGLDINGETLTIGPSGNLTVNGPELTVTVANNGRIVVNGGTLTINAGDEGRLSMDTGGAITVNQGLMEVDAGSGVKFPDNAGPVNITVNGGILRVSYIELNTTRSPMITIGGGALQVNTIYLDDPERRDPANWLAAGVLIPAPGYDQIAINPNNGQGFVEVTATGGPIGCDCLADLNDDAQIDLDDLQAVAQILLGAGSPFVVPVESGHCADLNDDAQIDLDDLQAVAQILLGAGSPFVVHCQ